MKITVLAENLDKGLGIVSHIVNSNNSLEVLSNVLFSTKNGRLQLQATNLEMAVLIEIGAKVEKEGSITIPARLIFDLIHSIKKGKLQLVSEDNNLVVKSINNESKINGIAASEFPAIPEIKTIKKILIPTEYIISAFETTLNSVSLDESRPVLSAVKLACYDNKLICVATDSYRLSEYKIDFKNNSDFSIIIPYRAIIELIRTIKLTNPKTIELQISENEVLFKFSSITFISQLIEGKYPDYTKIIPTNSSTKIIIDKNKLIDSLKIATLFARENAQTVQLKIDSKKLIINSTTTAVGTNSSEIEHNIKTRDLEINLNAKYILDAINNLSSKKITMSFLDKLSPCVVTPTEQGKKNQTLHIIMPLRS